MNDDQTFRLVLILALAILLPILAYHRIRSQTTGEKLDRRQEGLFILIGLRLLGLVCLIVLVAYLIDPALLAWSSLELPSWLRWAGVGLFVIAGALIVWTFVNLGKNLTDTVVTRKEHTLVTTGPYRWVRHPFYVGFAIVVLGISLITANWLFALGGAAAFVLLLVRTRKEEEKLIERFGDEYPRYMDRTGRFLPRLWRW
jgi:protein-S-isoprenylcysteine O-methyltransferase Ste14